MISEPTVWREGSKVKFTLLSQVGEKGKIGELRLMLAAPCVNPGCVDGQVATGFSPATMLDPEAVWTEDCPRCKGHEVVIYEDGDADFEFALSMVLDPLPEAEFEEASEQLDRLRREVHASRLRAFTARPFECAACGRLYDTRKLAGCSVCGSTIRLRAKEAA